MVRTNFPKFLRYLVLSFLCLHPFSRIAKAELSREEATNVKTAAQQALKTDPTNSGLWLRLGLADHALGNLDLAQSDFEKSVSIDPKNADAHYMLGLIYEKKKMNDRALSAWQAVLLNSQDAAKRDIAEKHIHHLSR